MRPFASISSVLSFGFVVAISVAACGNVDPSGNPDCPEVAPEPGSACDLPDGTKCGWDYFCGSPTTMGTCSGGEWQLSAAEAFPQDCPEVAPKEGDACCELEGKKCAYLACDAASGMGSGFTCVNSAWKAADVPCIPCGDIACNAGGLCVRHDQGPGASTFECIEYCGATATCDCASGQCGADATCSVDMNIVVCSCTNC